MHFHSKISILAIFALLISDICYGQLFRRQADEPESPRDKSVREILRNTVTHEGLFVLHQDTISGKLYMELDKRHLDESFIHFTHVVDGVADAGFVRGRYLGSRIFTVNRYFNKIEFILQNTNYYFDPENPLSRAGTANINKPVLFSQEIKAEDDTSIIIIADNIFLSERLQQLKSPPRPGANPAEIFQMGNLNSGRSKYLNLRSYPENTDVVVEYVFENPHPLNRGHESVTDPRFVSLKVQHSLIKLPQNDFKPRLEDPRIGFFTRQITDMTSVSATPYLDVINRWHLVKKDPNASLSEPVEPIVFWIENTTPYEFREFVKEGVLAWNVAFEKAGFKDAVQVKVQPDDADWDAGDIRYNTIRWTSSPRPRFGGYGPSMVDPRTGQILAADIMLEFVYLTHRVRHEQIFDLAGMDWLKEEQNQHDHFCHKSCHAGSLTQYHNMFASKAAGLDSLEEREILKQSLIRLVLHEVGHTLGLTHNFIASHWLTPEELADPETTKQKGVTASVMEYPAVNISRDRERQGLYYDISPGKYDKWVIEYGYSVPLDDPEMEKERLMQIANRSTEHGLAYGNDADDMRAPGRGIDPRIMIGDLSTDPVHFANEMIELVYDVLPELHERLKVEGEFYHNFRNAYLILTGQYGSALRVASRFVGGIQIERTAIGQETENKPFTPVNADQQRAAMKLMADYGFGVNAFAFSEELYPYLQMQRRGFNHRSSTEDPKLHERILQIQASLLSHLLHHEVQNRIVNSSLYGNTYDLASVMNDLSNAINYDDRNTTVSLMRQNLQIAYVKELKKIVNHEGGRYNHVAIANAHRQLTRIKQLHQNGSRPDEATRAHRNYMVYLIDKVLDA